MVCTIPSACVRVQEPHQCRCQTQAHPGLRDDDVRRIARRDEHEPECVGGFGRMFIRINGTGQIFGRWNNKPKFLERYVKKFGMKRWNWHNLRHRRASIWAKEERTLLEIMQLLGHSNLSTTQKYLQILGHIKL